MNTASPTPRLKFGGIEAARGVAAMLVAVYHGSRLVAQPRYAGAVPAGGLFADFNVGVDFFFVLSGFLITWVHWDDLGRRERIGPYAVRRATRIYPAYWLALLPMIVARLDQLGFAAGPPPGAGGILSSVLLLPSATPPILGVAWTLVFEMLFYVLFALAILAGRRMAVFAAAFWAAAIVATNLLVAPLHYPAAFFLNPYNLEFLLGVGAAALLRRHRIPLPSLVAGLGAIVFVGLMLFRLERLTGDDALAFRVAFGVPAAMVVVGTVELERRGRALVPARLALVGAASYAIYLVHSVAEPVALLALWPVLSAVPPVVVTLLLAAVGTGAGILFHLVAEKPVMQAVRRAIAGRVVAPA